MSLRKPCISYAPARCILSYAHTATKNHCEYWDILFFLARLPIKHCRNDQPLHGHLQVKRITSSLVYHASTDAPLQPKAIHVSHTHTHTLPCSDPIDRMISHFSATFRSDSYEEGCSLAITGGRGGARLTHSHER